MSITQIPLFKVQANAKQICQDLLPVFESGYIGEGQKVKEFEARFKAIVGSDVTPLTTNSCTAALILALKTIGIGPGDEVISTAMTCSASNLAILQTGARIVWADVDPLTGLIDPISAARAVTPTTKAIMAVDWGGTLCDYPALKRCGLPVIQDAAHCIHIGPDHGDYVAWSFGPIKHLTMSDGGALLTPAAKHDRARLLRWFGLDREAGESFRCSQDISLPGSKFHANDVMATIGLANMDLALKGIERARENAAYYNQHLQAITDLILPPCRPSNNWWLYSIVAPGRRAKLQEFLSDRGIGVSQVHARNDGHPVFYSAWSADKACATQANARTGPTGLKGLDFFAEGQLSIPVGAWVTNEQRAHVVKTIHEFYTTR